MPRVLAGRFVQALATLVALSVIVFVMGRVTGSPVDLLLPVEATPEQVKQLEQDLGLNESWFKQYIIFAGRTLRGDLGRSVLNKQPVVDQFAERFPATLELGIAGAVIVFGAGIPLGVLAALNHGRLLDMVVRFFAALAQALPSFWLGLMLMLLFGVQLEVLPVAGRGGWEHTILPAVSLSMFSLAGVLRLTRSGMLEALGQDYVMFARSKGLSERVVVMAHVLRNALIPVVTFSGLVVVSTFLTGSVVIETIFAWPGVGYMAYLSVVNRDYPALQAVVLIFGGMFILANFLVDISYAVLDPRIRVQA